MTATPVAMDLDPISAMVLHAQSTAGNRAVVRAVEASAAYSTPPTATALRALGSAELAAAGERRCVAADGISGTPAALVPVPDSDAADGEPVSVYDGPSSHRAAARLGAHAYTFRGSIALGAGLDESRGPGRNRTLAHELLHARQMRTVGPVATPAEAESAAICGDHSVRADPETPHGLFWLIPVAVGVYVLLRPNVANAPTPADVEAGRLQPSVSGAQVAGEALSLFAVPGGVTAGLTRAGFGVVAAMALGGAAGSMTFRGVQDAGVREFSGVQAYLVDAATGAVIGAVIGGTVRIYAGPQVFGAAQPRPNLVHFTDPAAQRAILATSESGQAIGELKGRAGIWALTDDALRQPPWIRATRATMPIRTAQAPVPIPDAAAGQFGRAVPVGPVSAFQYAMGVYRAPAGAISMATGEFAASGGVLANIRGLIFPYGLDTAIWVSAAALSGPPSATADQRGIRALLPGLPRSIQTTIEAHHSMTESTRSDGPFVVLPDTISVPAALAGAEGDNDPVAQVCRGPEVDAVQSADGVGGSPAIIYVAPFWPATASWGDE